MRVSMLFLFFLVLSLFLAFFLLNTYCHFPILSLSLSLLWMSYCLFLCWGPGLVAWFVFLGGGEGSSCVPFLFLLVLPLFPFKSCSFLIVLGCLGGLWGVFFVFGGGAWVLEFLGFLSCVPFFFLLVSSYPLGLLGSGGLWVVFSGGVLGSFFVVTSCFFLLLLIHCGFVFCGPLNGFFLGCFGFLSCFPFLFLLVSSSCLSSFFFSLSLSFHICLLVLGAPGWFSVFGSFLAFIFFLIVSPSSSSSSLYLLGMGGLWVVFSWGFLDSFCSLVLGSGGCGGFASYFHILGAWVVFFWGYWVLEVPLLCLLVMLLFLVLFLVFSNVEGLWVVFCWGCGILLVPLGCLLVFVLLLGSGGCGGGSSQFFVFRVWGGRGSSYFGGSGGFLLGFWVLLMPLLSLLGLFIILTMGAVGGGRICVK